MAEENRTTKHQRSPTSEEMKEQRQSGIEGAALGSREEGSPESEKQPPQGSNRPGHRNMPPEEKRLAEGRRPSEQGEEGSPSPGSLKEEDALQGIRGRGGSAHGERGEDEAVED